MFQTLSQYIVSLRDADEAGIKDRKIEALLSYYEEYKKHPAGPEDLLGVIYARYSSHNQREESIEDQVLDCLKYAAAEHIQIIGVYSDKAISGRTDDRASFRELLRDAGKKRWKYVVTWKIDRFARNRYDSAIYKLQLKKQGIVVRYAKEPIPEGPEGIILEGTLEAIAEYYSASLSQNVKRGCHGNALEAKSNGAHLPLGLMLDETRRYIPNPKTAPLVKMIFTMFNDGHSYSDIAEYLNSKGYRTSFGNKFGKNAIPTILRNPSYIGTYKYSDVVIENAFPAIIDPILWDSVQEKLGRRSKLNGKKKDSADFILTSKIYCGNCGSPFIGESGTGKSGTVYHYYKCIDRKRGSLGNGCSMRAVRKDWIEDLVIEETQGLIQNDETREHLINVVVAAQERDNDHSKLDALKSDLAQVNRELENVMDAIQQLGLTPTTKKRLPQLEERKAEIEAAIMEETAVRPVITKGDIAYFFDGFAHMDTSKPSYRQNLVDMLIHSIYVYKDKIVISYNFTDGPGERLTLKEIEKALEDAAFLPENGETPGVQMPSDMACQNPGNPSLSSPDFLFSV